MNQTHSNAHAEPQLAHVVPIKALLGVFAALVLLTAATVAIAHIDLGELNFVAAMAIATLKTALVVAVFMHLWWDRGFARVALLCGIVFFLLFVTLSVIDTTAYHDTIIWRERVLGQ